MLKKSGFIIIGAGSQARVVAAILQNNKSMLIGFVDDSYESYQQEIILTKPLIGRTNYLHQLPSQQLALGFGDNVKRKNFYELFASYHEFPVLQHPKSFIELYTTIHAGTVIASGAIICVGANIGKGVIINTGAIVEHECEIGDFSHICPGVKLAGNVRIGSCTQIGIGAIVIEGVSIGNHCVVGAGSVVLDDIPDGSLAYGVPARVIKISQ